MLQPKAKTLQSSTKQATLFIQAIQINV